MSTPKYQVIPVVNKCRTCGKVPILLLHKRCWKLECCNGECSDNCAGFSDEESRWRTIAIWNLSNSRCTNSINDLGKEEEEIALRLIELSQSWGVGVKNLLLRIEDKVTGQLRSDWEYSCKEFVYENKF